MTHNLIEVKNLTKHFSNDKKDERSYALNNLSLNVPEGCIYGIMGRSGAGKSTLLRCLTGLEIPTAGDILFDGEYFPYQNLGKLQRLRKQMGMVFQHFQLFSSKTVAQNIAFPLEISNVSSEQRQKRVKELLSLIGLESKYHYYPAQLSGGEKQRVGIARALAPNPKLLLCDEPTSALDPKTTREILQLLQKLNSLLGITIVIISHQLEAIKQVCQRVAILSKGKIVEENDVKHIFTQPQHEITKHLVHLSAESLPAEILRVKAGSCLIRLTFEGNETTQPLISQMIKKYDITVNILSGGLDYIQNLSIGHLFLELIGENEAITHALAFLRQHKVKCEVIR